MMPRPVSKNPLVVVISIMATWDEHHMSKRASERVPELTKWAAQGGQNEYI